MRWLALATLVGACFSSHETICSNGIVCPPGFVCGHATSCVPQAAVDACRDHSDGDTCTEGDFAGYCESGVCVAGCGDRIVESDEACDGQQPEGASCTSLGFEGGALQCNASCASDTSLCHKPSWSRSASGSPGRIYGMWAHDSGDVFAVGDAGAIAHWNGATWSRMSSPTASRLRGVWGSSGADVWAGGDGAVVHWDGGAWTVMAAGTFEIDAVSGTSASDVWMVGGDPSCPAATPAYLRHWDGSSLASWCFSTGLPAAVMHGLWATAPGDALAVGDQGAIVHLVTANNQFTVGTFLSGTTATLNAIWGAPGVTPWVAGDGVVLHEIGTAWQVVLDFTFPFKAVSGTGPNDVIIAGVLGTVLRWNGSQFAPEAVGTTNSLFAAASLGPAEDLVAGDFGEVFRNERAQWSVFGAQPTTKLELDAVWGSSSNDVFVVGYPDVVNHWNGTMWIQQNKGVSTNTPLHGISGTSATNIFAVGDGGAILHYDGSAWSPMVSPTTTRLRAVWTAGTTAIAVGEGGVILRWNGAVWTTEPSATTANLHGVWGSSPSDVFAVGDEGTIVHWDGAAWSPIPSGTAQVLSAVWGSGPTDVFAVGDIGTIVHWDGESWTTQISNTENNLAGISGTGPADVFAVGSGYILLHWDGVQWGSMVSPSFSAWLAVWAGHEVFAVDSNDLVAVRQRACLPAERRCGDGQDDDCDGLVDCGDPDCTADAKCAAGGACAGWTAISCGDSLVGTTVGGASELARYGCDSFFEIGPEVAYRLTGASGQVTVALARATADLDLVVLAEGAAGGCDPLGPSCVAASSTVGDESVTFSAQPGESYYVVVDGFGHDAGSFELSVSCP